MYTRIAIEKKVNSQEEIDELTEVLRKLNHLCPHTVYTPDDKHFVFIIKSIGICIFYLTEPNEYEASMKETYGR